MTKEQYENIIDEFNQIARRIEGPVSEIQQKLDSVDWGLGGFVKMQNALIRAVRWNTRIIIVLLIVLIVMIGQ